MKTTTFDRPARPHNLLGRFIEAHEYVLKGDLIYFSKRRYKRTTSYGMIASVFINYFRPEEPCFFDDDGYYLAAQFGSYRPFVGENWFSGNETEQFRNTVKIIDYKPENYKPNKIEVLEGVLKDAYNS